MERIYLEEADAPPFLACDIHEPTAENACLLVFCHGLLGSRRGIKISELTRTVPRTGRGLAAFDFRGRGDSSGSLEGLTLSRNIRDLAAVVDRLRPLGRRLVLVGSSFGGLTAAWYAAQRPGDIAAAVLIAPAFGFIERWGESLGPENLRRWRVEGRRSFDTEEGPVKFHYDLVEDAEAYPRERLCADFSTPVLVIHGVEDDTVPYGGSLDFVRSVKVRPAELLLIAGGSHALNEHAGDILPMVRSFLERLGVW